MEIKRSYRQVFGSLYFRILAPIVPIVILMALAGSVIFSLGLSTASHYANDRILDDLERNSRDIYSLCDTVLQGLLLDGYGDTDAIIKVRKGTTLGKIEDYAAQNDLQVVVYSTDTKRILLSKTL